MVKRRIVLTAALVFALPVLAGAAPGTDLDRSSSRPVSITGEESGAGQQARLIPATIVIPEYPPAARRGRITARVHLAGVIDAEGRVQALACMDCASDPAGFGEAAIQALAAWSYRPALTPDGTPVSVSISFDVRFQLE